MQRTVYDVGGGVWPSLDCLRGTKIPTYPTSPANFKFINFLKLLPVEWNFRGIICRNIPFRIMRDVQQKNGQYWRLRLGNSLESHPNSEAFWEIEREATKCSVDSF
jgi:hypothetical protein